MDEIRQKRLQTPMDNLLTYFQTNKGAKLAWPDVKKILKKDGAQDKDLKSPKDLFRLFPRFLLTDSRGQVNPKTGPFFVSIPAGQEKRGGRRGRPGRGARGRTPRTCARGGRTRALAGCAPRA